MPENFDCIVIGAGPAGSTVAALVAEAGFSTLLVEREKMPRFHVGESLMPETYWTLERLGVLDRLRASACPKKFSVQFVNDRGKASRPFYFHKHDDRECSQTWQVWRSDFDQMLFENAGEKGAVCRDQTRVLDVRFESDRATGVRIQGPEGMSEIGARVVVDATGQQSLIASRLGIRRINPDLRKSAVWAYYRDARRDEGIDSGATIIMHTAGRKSWFWFIPLADEVTSIGVVGDTDYLLKGRGKAEEIFAEELANCPALLERLENAEQTGEYYVAREFSYTTERSAGEGWVLVGDALGFVDPIYSSGVFLALVSGEWAADCIVAGLKKGDTSAAQLGSWAEKFEEGVEWIRKLVHAFYTDGFSFGKFIKNHPEHIENLTELLIGRVFHPAAGEIFKDMDPWMAEAAGTNAEAD